MGDKTRISTDSELNQPIFCRVCQKQFSQHACPRCTAQCCLLPCHKSHSLCCTEPFMCENVMGELQQLHTDGEVKKRTLDKLKCFHSEEEERNTLDENGTILEAVPCEPVDSLASKNIFLSAIRFATSAATPPPSAPFGNELKTSAQEQVEYMLGEDKDAPLVIGNEEVKAEIRYGLSNIHSSFQKDLSFLILESNLEAEDLESKIMQSLSDLEWMCNILPKMDLMKDFVATWGEISINILNIATNEKISPFLWGFKIKLIEITLKVFEAIGYGNVTIQAGSRVHLLKTWLPFIRKMKPLLESMQNEDSNFPYKMDEELFQGVEGAIVTIVSALPSGDQADILADWMRGEHVKYPDLSEAFEVWCYRTKSAKRRLLEGSNIVSDANGTPSPDLSH